MTIWQMIGVTAACLGGVVVLVLITTLLKSYVKAPASRAFVRTGGFFRKPDAPPKVVMNGGAWVFGLVHVVTWVDLGTMAIEIERTEQNALLTKDPQYADIKAIFYIKVAPTVEGIIDAARTIGMKAVDDLTLQVTTKDPFPPLPATLYFWAPLQAKALQQCFP